MTPIASETLIFGAYVAIALVFLLLLMLYLRAFKAKPQAQQDPVQNFTEMAVLFQTLRGIVEEQKNLAREFNQHIDRKAALIREAVKTVLAAQKKVEAQLALLNEQKAAQAEPQKQPAVQPAPEPVFICVPEPVLDETEEWVGLELPSEPAPVEEASPVRDAPEVLRQTREAFRALLDMEEDAPQDEQLPQAEEGDSAASLRERVYRYHDAGMSIAEISQELGIGKGEARLMLGLRRRQANS